MRGKKVLNKKKNNGPSGQMCLDIKKNSPARACRLVVIFFKNIS
jgi:hypothetical protein